jgi:hypothetical protein
MVPERAHGTAKWADIPKAVKWADIPEAVE